jgi:MoxR-like ATPase
VDTLAKTVDLQFSRVQFTIDLLPSDIVGSEILDQRTSEFRTRKGPIFTNLLLADEINRGAPKLQSALLEAMQERRVTIGNETFSLPQPFVVIATQNPVEHSGTFELPEAQLDRFMMCHRLNYPTLEEEEEVLRRNLNLGLKRDASGAAVARTEFDVMKRDPAGTMADLNAAMEAVHHVHVSEVFQKHVIELIHRTRRHANLEFGCSPRGCIALTKAARARACLLGRDHVLPEDLFALAEDIVLHRVRLKYEAVAQGSTGRAVLSEILNGMG